MKYRPRNPDFSEPIARSKLISLARREGGSNSYALSGRLFSRQLPPPSIGWSLQIPATIGEVRRAGPVVGIRHGHFTTRPRLDHFPSDSGLRSDLSIARHQGVAPCLAVLETAAPLLVCRSAFPAALGPGEGSVVHYCITSGGRKNRTLEVAEVSR